MRIKILPLIGCMRIEIYLVQNMIMPDTINKGILIGTQKFQL